MCPLILTFALLCILAFYALVEARSRACEGMYTPDLDAPEAWHASLDVALGEDYLTGTPMPLRAPRKPQRAPLTAQQWAKARLTMRMRCGVVYAHMGLCP